MISKILYTVTLAGLFGIASQLPAQAIHTERDAWRQSKEDTKSIAGKVISIADSGTSFAVEIEGSSNRMEFLLNEKTQVQGKVKIGTLVAVDYQRTDGGQNLALNVTARS
jgi:hypothetical protein